MKTGARKRVKHVAFTVLINDSNRYGMEPTRDGMDLTIVCKDGASLVIHFKNANGYYAHAVLGGLGIKLQEIARLVESALQEEKKNVH